MVRNRLAQLVGRIRNDAKAVKILTEWLGSGGEPVEIHFAEARARICVSCPHNKVKTGRLEATIAEAIRKQEEIRHQIELRTPYDYNLQTCAICGCYQKLKVWVPLKHIPEEPGKFPPHCWISKERATPPENRIVSPIIKERPRTDPEPANPNIPHRPVIRIRREDAFGDVIQASVLATKLWTLGYDVHWRSSNVARTALYHHPHIARFIEDKNAAVDVNLDRTYEDNLERKSKPMAQLFSEAAAHQLKRGGFLPVDFLNSVPNLALTDGEVQAMRQKLSHLTGRIVAYVPKSNFWPSRTIHPDSIRDSVSRIRAKVVWCGTGDPPSHEFQRVELKTFRDVMALIALSDVVVTPDTGPMHVAAAFNKPIVAIEQCIPVSLRLSDQTDWVAVAPPLNCIRCGEFNCPIDREHPPCQIVPPEAIAAAVNTKLDTIDGEDISVVIPVYKDSPRLKRCLAALEHQPEIKETIIALDGGCALAVSGAKVIKSPPSRTGFGRTVMRGVRASTGSFILILNDDCYLHPGALAVMLETIKRAPTIGVVGAQLWYPDGTLQHGGTSRRTGEVGFGHIDFRRRVPSITKATDMEFVTFAAVLVRRKAFYAVRGFDEQYDCYCEDSDFCLSVKQAGYRVIYNPDAKATHDESQSTSPMKAQLTSHGDRIFRKKWSYYFEHNPV